MRRGGKRRAAHSRNPVLQEAPLRTCDRTRTESTPRDCHATHRRISLFSMDKFSGLPISYSTLLRSVPGSFWDFPAPRFWSGGRGATSLPFGSEVLASTDHPIRFSPVVGARCRPPKSKINLLPANGYSPSTENGGIVPYHDMNRNKGGVVNCAPQFAIIVVRSCVRTAAGALSAHARFCGARSAHFRGLSPSAILARL